MNWLEDNLWQSASIYLLCLPVPMLEKLLSSAIITNTPSTPGYHIHICNHTHKWGCGRQRPVQQHKHTHFITQRPQWDWGWPVTGSRWTPSSLSVLSCVSCPAYHPPPYPLVLSFSSQVLHGTRGHRWTASHSTVSVCVIVRKRNNRISKTMYKSNHNN